jgi:release factor glutamine methyltransferase
MNIQNAIQEGSQVLRYCKCKTPLLDSEILMSKAIHRDKHFVILNPNMIIKKNDLNVFKKLIKKRSTGQPISYLIGIKSFWKNDFEVNSNTLIPRPDTELIIEEVLKLSKNRSMMRILDIGVGSGCILLSILNEKKNFCGIGIDISKKCVDLSKKNSYKLNLNKRVKFFKSDVDNFNYGKYDLIISNPPYIKQFDLKYLEKDVVNFEPKLALNGGLDGLSEIRKVINKSSELIKINGKLILEIGFDQKEKVKNILKNKGFYINRVLKDLANNDRCIISTKI